MATEVGLNPADDYDQRKTGRTPGGKYACFEFENLSKIQKYKNVK